jgi:hypothetical protein
MDEMAMDPDREASPDQLPSFVLPTHDQVDHAESSESQPEIGSSPALPVPQADETTTTKRFGKRSLVVATVAAVVLLGVVLGTTLSSGPDADAAIVTAINTAIGQKTAHATLTGSVTLKGTTVSLSGNGSFDFSDNAVQLVANLGADGQQESLQVLYVDGTVYEGLPQIGQLAPGKSWVSLDLSSLQQTAGEGGVGQLGGDPLATLHALAQQGNTVQALGPSAIDGQSVQGYSVTLNSSAVQRGIQHANLPGWLRQTVSRVTFGSGSEAVFLDGTGNLVRITAAITESVGSTGAVSVQESYDFSDYGTPVSITAPPASTVLPLDQFIQLAKGSQAA